VTFGLDKYTNFNKQTSQFATESVDYESEMFLWYRSV